MLPSTFPEIHKLKLSFWNNNKIIINNNLVSNLIPIGKFTVVAIIGLLNVLLRL